MSQFQMQQRSKHLFILLRTWNSDWDIQTSKAK